MGLRFIRYIEIRLLVQHSLDAQGYWFNTHWMFKVIGSTFIGRSAGFGDLISCYKFYIKHEIKNAVTNTAFFRNQLSLLLILKSLRRSSTIFSADYQKLVCLLGYLHCN